MSMIKTVGLTLGLGLSLGLSTQVQALTVATSFSILDDMVKNVAGDKVKVVNLIGADSDAHSFELSPSDVAKLGGKEQPAIFFVNGLGLDDWSQRMVSAANFKGKVVVLTEGIKERKFDESHDHTHADAHDKKTDTHDHDTKADAHEHSHDHDVKVDAHEHSHDHEVKVDAHAHSHDHDAEKKTSEHEHSHATVTAAAAHDHDKPAETHDHAHDAAKPVADDHHHHGDIDPHAWQSLPNALVYVDNITKALSATDPENKAHYQDNAQAYKQKITALHQKIKQDYAPLAHERRYLVTTHEALGYFADEYHLHMVSPLGFSSSAQPSAKEVASVVKQVREAKIPALFLENVKNPALLEQIARESGAKIGGTLHTDALSASGPASTYLGMVQENARVILDALK